MGPTERDRLEHMLEAARDAAEFVRGRAREDLTSDSMLRRAVLQCITVIGEASAHIRPETRALLPDVPWREIRAMRNLIAHRYFRLNLDVVWQTATEHLAPLIASIERALAERRDE